MMGKIKYGDLDHRITNKESYVEFTSAAEAQAWGEKHYGEWSEEYHRVMYVAKNVIQDAICQIPLEAYCGNNYPQVNEYFRC